MGLETAGGYAQYRGAKKAASAQKEAAYEASQTAREISDKQMELYKQIWDKQQADQAPYLQQGQAAIGKLGSLMGLKQKMTPQEKGNAIISVLTGGGNPSPIESNNGIKNYNSSDNPLNDPFESYLQKTGLQGGLDAYLKQKGVSNYGFLNSPQYQFLLKQGQNQLDRNNASSGMGYSGSQLKAAQQFGQGLASQQYDNEYNRAAKEYFNKYDQARGQFGDYYNRLAGIAQGGQQTAQSLGGMGSQYATNARNTLGELSNEQSNILGQQANARASAYATKANALNDTLGGLADLWSMRRKAV